MIIFKVIFKLILQLFFVTIFFSTLHARNIDKLSEREYISNYFSGILLLNDKANIIANLSFPLMKFFVPSIGSTVQQ